MTPPQGAARTVPRWVVYLAALVGLALVGSAGAVGYSASQELARQQANLSQAQAELATQKSDLASVQGSLAEARTTHAALVESVASVQTTLDGQTACVDARRADFDELDRISKLLNDNWNRTSEDSEFQGAKEARADALNDARDAYYQAALKRSLGQISSSNSWLSKARAYEKKADEKKVFMDSVLKAVDTTAGEIEAALNALQSTLEQTRATCARTG